jgi:hypothetical protein
MAQDNWPQIFQTAADGQRMAAYHAGSAASTVNNALAANAEAQRKLAAEQRKRQADAESEERKRQHELKLEQMRIDALAMRLNAYQR